MATIERSIESLGADTTLAEGRPAVVLSLTPSAIDERVPLDWHEGTDELDRLRAAAVRIAPEDVTFVLLAYERDPQQTTSILAEPSDTVGDDLAALFDALGVKPEHVVDHAPWAGGRPVDLGAFAEAGDLERSADELARQLSTIRAATAQLHRRLASLLADRRDIGLTERQREVLALSAQGHTRDEVADRLSLSPASVQRHLRRAQQAIGAELAGRS